MYDTDKAKYQKLQRDALAIRQSRPIEACAVVISACQDRETANDGSNGLFTEKLLDVYANGAYADTYYDLWRDVRREVALVNMLQHPAYGVFGTTDQAFLSSAVFTL